MRSAETARMFCTFRVDGRLYGVDMLDVKEVTTETACTPIAHAPEDVVGLVNIRGHIYLALDLRRLLGISAFEVTANTRLVLFKPTVGSAFGIFVDEISEIHTAVPRQLESFHAEERDVVASLRRTDLITSICKLPDELLVVLNPRRFLGRVETQLNESTA